jgi:hypothetical protein
MKRRLSDPSCGETILKKIRLDNIVEVNSPQHRQSLTFSNKLTNILCTKDKKNNSVVVTDVLNHFKSRGIQDDDPRIAELMKVKIKNNYTKRRIY